MMEDYDNNNFIWCACSPYHGDDGADGDGRNKLSIVSSKH